MLMAAYFSVEHEYPVYKAARFGMFLTSSRMRTKSLY